MSGVKAWVNRLFPPLPRAEGVTDRMVVLGFGGRFTDEILSGLPSVLMPTIRTTLGLSLDQVGLLDLALNYVASIVEPINGFLIDLWPRRYLLAWGAAVSGLAIILIGLAPTFAMLALAYGIYGLASGPLAHTADVVLIEAHPEAADRIFTRATLIDTVGALLAPLFVAVAFWLQLDWHLLLITLGSASIIYALFLWRTRFPQPRQKAAEKGAAPVPFFRAIRTNLSTVLKSQSARRWLLLLLLFSIVELPMSFAPIWLHEEVGMSQALVGIYRAAEMGIGVLTLIMLERRLHSSDPVKLLRWAVLGTAVILPLWLFLPGIWLRFLLMIPQQICLTVIWPLSKSQSLQSVPGNAGAVTAVDSLLNILPLGYLFGLSAERFDLTSTMLVTGLAGAVLMLLMLTTRSRSP